MRLSNYIKTRSAVLHRLKACILLPALVGLAYGSAANAIDFNGGVLDEPFTDIAKGSAQSDENSADSNNGNGNNGSNGSLESRTQRELARLARQEQRELEKKNRAELRELAKNGERLAQVVLANDFAEEAQLLTYAPAAANEALSDAIALYSLAAQRGYPGAASLDRSGISYQALRVVRNK